ncbi:MAG: class I SAM-dependent methyltransferase [Eubacteriaceae bacterium]|nr:class I SAM-dependent methyltransferase [Eubacteriaceae bacterium]
MKLINNVNDIAHLYFEKIISDGDTVIDATCGNGHDTLILCRLAGSGKVYAFDIQPSAVEATKALLAKNGISGAEVILDGHENMRKYVTEDAKLVVFNLGYLPGSDKKITTAEETTLRAVKEALELTKNGGYISICAYLGHDGAMEEYSSLKKFLSLLPNKGYNVLEMKHTNRKETSPVYILIEKI